MVIEKTRMLVFEEQRNQAKVEGGIDGVQEWLIEIK